MGQYSCRCEYRRDHGVPATTLLGAGDTIATIQQPLACQGDTWKQVESGYPLIPLTALNAQ
jgi:hypothetical protein